MSPASPLPSNHALILIGVGQIFAWGVTYYLPAVAAPIWANEPGLSGATPGWALTLALAIQAVAAPFVGQLQIRFGGKNVLSAGMLVLAAGLAVLANATTAVVFFFGWAILGIAMAASLYDSAFGAIAQIYRGRTRQKITELTLLGGFASSVFWPTSGYLFGLIGWRHTLLLYAAVACLLLAPLYLLCLDSRRVAQRRRHDISSEMPVSKILAIPGFLGLATTMVLLTVVTTAISMHLIQLLQQKGISFGDAVVLGALLGPGQVAARVVERVLGIRFPAHVTLFASLGLIGTSLALLTSSVLPMSLAIFIYGAGAGLKSIGKGTVALQLVGAVNLPAALGILAPVALITQAATPAVSTWVLNAYGIRALEWGLLAATAAGIATMGFTAIELARILPRISRQ